MRVPKKYLILFLLPATVVFTFVYAIPLIMLISTSFTDWKVGSAPVFNGIHNYIQLFTEDSQFLRACINTVIWMILQATLHVGIGVTVALILARKKFYWKFVRTVYMLPNIISSAAVGMMFVMLLNPSFGVVNSALSKMGFADLPNWFMDPGTSFLAVTITWLPFAATVTILIMAEMTSIDEGILEAARIDGAAQSQINIYIVLPLMKNMIGTTTILAATSMLQKLDIIMMTTKGGPGDRTLNLPVHVYKTAFIANDFGMSNTIGVVMIVAGMLAVGIINRIYKIGKSNMEE